MFNKTIKTIFISTILIAATCHADLNNKNSKFEILITTGRIDSQSTPNAWKALKDVLRHNHSHPCSKMKPFHDLFNRMHKYEEKHYDRFVPKEGNVGYKIWYDLKEGRGKFSFRS